MTNENEQVQLETVFVRLGATPAQARSMALQLVKRCDQMVRDRGFSRPEAMAYLLQLVQKGRSGETPAGFEGTPPPGPPPPPSG